MRITRRLGILLLALLFLWSAAACADESFRTELQEAEWTWNESSSASFTGTVSFDELPCEKLLLKLSFTTDPDSTNQGNVVFHTVNGKKLTIRKQQPEYTFAPGELKSFDFTGTWKTPENVFFTKIVITFQVCTEDGETVLGESKLTVQRDASELAKKEDGKFRLKTDFSKWTLWIAVAAGVIWVLAAARILWNHKRSRKEG